MSCRTRPDRSEAWSLFEPQFTVSMFLGTMTVVTYATMVVALGTASVVWHKHSEVGNHPTFIAAKAVVGSPSRVELWRGLPRYSPTQDGVVARQRAFGFFEPESIQLTDEQAQWLRDYCTQEWHFDVSDPGVIKACVGFHADWAVVFTSCEHSAEFAFCSGCGEAKIQADGHSFVHVDVRDVLVHSYLGLYRAK
jgi:hypothetical protein